MNKRRSRRAPNWPGIAACVAAIAFAALVVAFAVKLFSGTLNLMRTDGGATTRDPQFAEPAETVTRPPELSGAEGAPGDAEDPSANWDLGVQTPVDKTAEELSREEAAYQSDTGTIDNG